MSDPLSSTALIRILVWTSALVLTALVAYGFAPVLTNGFVNWDDGYAVLDNYALRESLGTFWQWAWQSRLLGVYQPLAWLALYGQYQAGESAAGGYHLMSLVLHLVNVLLTFCLALRLRRFTSTRFSPSDVAWSLVAAGLFGLHPARVEVVAWVSCQPYLLATFFALLSLIAYTYSAALKAGAIWRAVALGCFAASCLAKATGVFLPVAFLALDCFVMKGGNGSVLWRQRCRRLAPFFGVGAATIAAALWARAPVGVDIFTRHLSVWQRTMQAVKALGMYFAQTVFPLQLAPFQPIDGDLTPQTLSVLAPTAVLIGLAIAAWRWRYTWPQFGICCGLSLLGLAPTLGLFKIADTAASDRYTYLALLPWLGLLTIKRPVPWSAWLTTAAAGLALAVLAGLTYLSRQQCAIWHDSITLWTGAIERGAQDEVAAHNNLGSAYGDVSRWHEAELEFRQVLRLQPDYALAYSNLGIALYRQGELEAAKAPLLHALALVPHFPEALANLGDIALEQRDPVQAKIWLIEALSWTAEVTGGTAKLHHDLALSLAMIGEMPQATAEFAAALRLDPSLASQQAAVARSLAAAGFPEVSQAIGLEIKQVSATLRH